MASHPAPISIVLAIFKLKSHFAPVLLIGAASLLLSGCVYLRLLEVKKQLSHFDDNFAIPTTEDLTLKCLHPLLQAEDLRWLGAVPKTVVPRDGGEDWVVRWVKETAPGIQEALTYDMVLKVRFVGGRVVEATIPKRHLAYVSKELLVNMLRSTGTAKVNRNERQADAQTEAPVATSLPNLTAIKAMMGEPTSTQTTPERIVNFYRYSPDSLNTTAKSIEASFAFDSATGELRKFTVRLPRGTLSYDFKTAASATKSMADDATAQPARSGP